MMSLNSLQEKYKNFVTPVILALVFIFDFAFIMVPQIKTAGRLSSKASVLKKDLRSARKDIASRKEFEDKLALLKSKISDFSSNVTPEEELPSVLEGISRTSNQTYVKITQIKPLKEEKIAILKAEAGIYYQLSILIDLKGAYHSLGDFLNHLENGPVLMKIIGLEVTANPADATQHLVRLTAVTYVLGK